MREEIAEELLQLWGRLASRELSHILEELDKVKKQFSHHYYRMQTRANERKVTKLKTLIAGLNSHKQALCEFVLYRAANTASADNEWKWKTGDDIPVVLKASSTLGVAGNIAELVAPPQLLCTISQELMDDPVITCDGFTYDRNNIER